MKIPQPGEFDDLLKAMRTRYPPSAPDSRRLK